MGSSASSQVTKEEIREFQKKTNLDEVELKNLWTNFTRISSSKKVDGVIDREEWMEALGLSKDDPLANRLFYLFDENGDGFDLSELCLSQFLYLFNQSFINAKEFISTLSILSNKSSFEEKLSCLDFLSTL